MMRFTIDFICKIRFYPYIKIRFIFYIAFIMPPGPTRKLEKINITN